LRNQKLNVEAFMKSVLKTLILGACLALSACAKDSGGGGGGAQDVAVVPPATTCPAGQAYTNQYGCLPQGGCQANFVTYGNQCIVATANTCAIGQVNTQYGCLPQGICPVGQAQLNTQCVAANVNGGFNGNFGGGNYNGNYNGSFGGSFYSGNGVNWPGYYRTRTYGNGGYYGSPYGYGGGAGVGINAGFYIGGQIGGQAGVPGMYYGY
jgi:hypothetical protein